MNKEQMHTCRNWVQACRVIADMRKRGKPVIISSALRIEHDISMFNGIADIVETYLNLSEECEGTNEIH